MKTGIIDAAAKRPLIHVNRLSGIPCAATASAVAEIAASKTRASVTKPWIFLWLRRSARPLPIASIRPAGLRAIFREDVETIAFGRGRRGRKNPVRDQSPCYNRKAKHQDSRSGAYKPMLHSRISGPSRLWSLTLINGSYGEPTASTPRLIRGQGRGRPEKLMKSIELYGTKVMPVVNDMLAWV